LSGNSKRVWDYESALAKIFEALFIIELQLKKIKCEMFYKAHKRSPDSYAYPD